MNIPQGLKDGVSWRAFTQLCILILVVQFAVEAVEHLGFADGEAGNHSTSLFSTLIGVIGGKVLGKS